MTEKYILVSDEEYCYTLNTQSEHYKTLEDFEKQEFENAKKDNVDIQEYEDAILESANDKYWDWVYNNHLEADIVNGILNELAEENEQLKQEIKKLHEQIFTHSIEFKSLHNDYRTLKLQDDDRKLYQRKLAKENEQLKQFIQSLTEQSVNGKVMLRDGKVYDLNKILKKGDVE